MQPTSYRKVATMYYNGNGSFKLVEDVFDLEYGVSAAVYLYQMFENGWGKLNITSSDKFDDEIQMYASGFLEGHLTRQQIYDHALNQYYVYGFLVDQIPKNISDFMSGNLNFMKTQVSNHKGKNDANSIYWRQVALVLKQLSGLVDGYNYALSKESMRLSELQLFILNAAGDMEDLVPALTNNQFKTMKQKIFEYINNENDDSEEPLTDCSALIKFTGTDLYAGHTTWRSYGIIDKMYKVYNFGLGNVSARQVSFSSSPGFLSSKDDFYIMQSSNMVSMETTLSIFNKTLYDLLTPESVLCWVRSIVANQLSNSGREWTAIFSKYNSGTYNNQWMIVDYKRFVAGKVNNDLLWILEQIPGYIRTTDASGTLKDQGFWSSYNIPFFNEVYNLSGYQEAKQKFGDDYDYQKCPRAKIFKREQEKVRNLDGFGRVLQFNQWQTDPFSKDIASNTIASRYDLRKNKPVPFGGIDSKITNFKLVKYLAAVGIAGPTHQDQIPFTWSSADWGNVSHAGQPDTWNFDWTTMLGF